MSYIETTKYNIQLAIAAYEAHITKKYSDDMKSEIDDKLKELETSYNFWHMKWFGVKFPTREDAEAIVKEDNWELSLMLRLKNADLSKLKQLSTNLDGVSPYFAKIKISSDDAWILTWIPNEY